MDAEIESRICAPVSQLTKQKMNREIMKVMGKEYNQEIAELALLSTRYKDVSEAVLYITECDDSYKHPYVCYEGGNFGSYG